MQYILKSIYSLDGKAECSHDPSETIQIWGFAAQKTFLNNAENNYAAS